MCEYNIGIDKVQLYFGTFELFMEGQQKILHPGSIDPQKGPEYRGNAHCRSHLSIGALYINRVCWKTMKVLQVLVNW